MAGGDHRKPKSWAQLERDWAAYFAGRPDEAAAAAMMKALRAANRSLTPALKLAHAVEWDDEYRELLHDSVQQVRAVLRQLEQELGRPA